MKRGTVMKWFLVALLVSGASPNGAGEGPHSGGHAMHAWELGEGDPARIVCLFQIETFIQHRSGKVGASEGLEPRVRSMVEIEMVRTLLCLDEATVKTLAGSRLGRDTMDIRPFGELKRALPKLPLPPESGGMTPDDGAPAILRIPFPPVPVKP